MAYFEDRWIAICGNDIDSRMTERETEFIKDMARTLDRLLMGGARLYVPPEERSVSVTASPR